MFVSHNMALIRSLCSVGLLLDKGRVILNNAPIETAIAGYVDMAGDPSNQEHTVILPAPPSQCDVWMESASVLCNGTPAIRFEFGDKISLRVTFKARAPIRKPILGYLIRSDRGENAVNANNYFLPSPEYADPVTEGSILCDLGILPLMAGSYSVSFWLCRNPHEQHHVEDALRFTVDEKDIWETGRLPTRNLSSLWWPTDFAFLPREQNELTKN